MRVRAFVVTLALLTPFGIGVDLGASRPGFPEASAAVSVLASLDELVQRSAYVVVATASDQRSAWEDIAGSKRIVTYTRLVVESAIVGELGAEIWVRTLGGAVGDIGQAVSGEARIAPGSRSLLFLTKPAGAVVVTGMAQGHFPIAAAPDGTRRLTPSPDAGALLRRQGPAISARETLVGLTVDQAIDTVRRARRAQDADRK